ncbi:hypothetical protein [Marinibactrum halimedae]|uniref:Acetyltransferase n=1 Tax=Marinibactrum halimedae TaxID=1444977 RepID=A0AA37WLL0_9GAMM|nr:hypothetical protein [Marinibactrum halimedae]MCD9459656.1 hypothetical protein [Marinibactrum halimedae]GLS25683.1 hypothetical protein GCM10007877_13970 [Marinibactrum halimedae]
MLMMLKEDAGLVEVESIRQLSDPYSDYVMASKLRGEEQQEPEPVPKKSLVFVSGERLPACWVNVNYREHSYGSRFKLVSERNGGFVYYGS